MGIRPAILVDTNIVIEAVRVGVWERLRAHESVMTVRQCCEEALSGIPGTPGRIPVTEADLAPPLHVADVTDAQRAALLVTSDAAGALDAGERDLLAHAVTMSVSGNPFVLVCADQAAVRVAVGLTLGDHIISLEEVLKAAGVKVASDLKAHYTRRRLDEWRTKWALGM